MQIDFDEEEDEIERDLRWATDSESKVQSEAKRALRKLDDRIKSLESDLEELQEQSNHLLGIIEGSIKPSAVDLPKEKADDFKTKLRLRIKGIRGIAKEKAEKDLIPVEEKITKLEGKIERENSRVDPVERDVKKTREALQELENILRDQRSFLRETRSAQEDLTKMTGVFGWYNPNLLSGKALEEVSLSRWRLKNKGESVQKRREELGSLEKRVNAIKDDMKSTLGEAYEVSFLPIIFKSGKSPEGKRFNKNELTLFDVENLDIEGKIAHHKSLGRKADRLSSQVAERTQFISDALHRIGRLCEQMLYKKEILKRSQMMEKIAAKQLESKIEISRQILTIADNCRLLSGRTREYLEKKHVVADRRRRADEILGGIRSDLLKI